MAPRVVYGRSRWRPLPVRPATCDVFGHRLTVDLLGGRCLRCGLVEPAPARVEVIRGSETEATS